MLLDAPWAFGASPEGDKGLDVAHLERSLAGEGYAIFAIDVPAPTGSWAVAAGETREEPELIAAAGIMRARSPKFAHRASIWGVFVEPAYRRKGLGRAVVTAAIDLARSWSGVDYVDLGASERAPEAQCLYESLGFRAWGRAPEATEHEGRRYDEIHMTLRLRPGDGRGA
jgi:RimJ/RimL family protein N-acetyltransferase